MFSFVLLLTFAIVLDITCADIQSTVIVKDQAGNDVGPQISLSSTVLTTGQSLSYTCIENSDAEDNRLQQIFKNGTIRQMNSDRLQLQTRVCNIAVDRIFWCTVVTGQVSWRREYGGKYACGASPDEPYYIHWINPVVAVPENKDLPATAYGSDLTIYCSVDMTPTDISYSGIMKVIWQFRGARTGSQWTSLSRRSDVSSVIAPTGANYTLTIHNFNPITHGGEYRCIARILRYPQVLVSNRVNITSQPAVSLKNNKRIPFLFGTIETNVKFSCEALSYPFPKKIEFRLQNVVINEHTNGVSEYMTDTVSVNRASHIASFVVNNMVEVFRNDSVLECLVIRKDGGLAIAQTRITLVD